MRYRIQEEKEHCLGQARHEHVGPEIGEETEAWVLLSPGGPAHDFQDRTELAY